MKNVFIIINTTSILFNIYIEYFFNIALDMYVSRL